MKKRKYFCKEDYFETWSRDMAYILGFTFSDGNIYRTTLSYSIAEKDICILKYIKRCLRFSGDINKFERINISGVVSKVCRIRINSRKMINILSNKYGLIPNKSAVMKISFPIPDEFRGDFIRGFFDGDGWVYNRRNGVECGMCTASKNMIHSLYGLCGNVGRIRERTAKSHKLATMPLYSIEMETNDSLSLRDLMYQNEPFCLLRKKERFWGFYIPSEKLWTKEQENKLKENINLSISEISKTIGKSEKSVQMKKFKMGLCPKKSLNWKWSKEEDEKVKTISDINLLVGLIKRSRAAIVARRSFLGVSSPNLWEPKDTDLLINNQDKSRKELSMLLKKSECSVKSKLDWLREKGLITQRKSGRPVHFISP